MEKFTKVLDDQLLDYLDGKLDPSKLALLKTQLESSHALKARLDELRLVHRVLASSKLESPSTTFVNRVMVNLNKTSLSSSLSPKNGLLLLMGVTVATVMLLVLLGAGVFDQFKGSLSLPETLPAQKYLQESLPAIAVNGKLMINILVGLNLVLAFLVLDKTVFKPYFQRRAGAQL